MEKKKTKPDQNIGRVNINQNFTTLFDILHRFRVVNLHAAT